LCQNFDTTSTNLPNSNEVEEYDPTIAPTSSQQLVPSIKVLIVIQM
jgi:hypothetical protein